MINVANFERRSRFLVKAIADKVKYDNESSPKYAYWALYLDDNRRKPREVDTCATSYCISILETEKQRLNLLWLHRYSMPDFLLVLNYL